MTHDDEYSEDDEEEEASQQVLVMSMLIEIHVENQRLPYWDFQGAKFVPNDDGDR